MSANLESLREDTNGKIASLSSPRFRPSKRQPSKFTGRSISNLIDKANSYLYYILKDSNSSLIKQAKNKIKVCIQSSQIFFWTAVSYNNYKSQFTEQILKSSIDSLSLIKSQGAQAVLSDRFPSSGDLQSMNANALQKYSVQLNEMTNLLQKILIEHRDY